MSQYDVKQLKQAVSLTDLIGQVVDLKQRGNEYKGLCPFHDEKTPSFAIFTGKDGGDRYNCHGCGAKGDHLQFLQDYYQLDFSEAVSRLANQSLLPASTAPKRKSAKQPKPADEWQDAIAPANEPAPATLWVCRDDDWIEVPVVSAWAYRDTEGNLRSYACRVEFIKPDGTTGKDVIPVCWRVHTTTGEAKWKQGALPYPRILYGSELLASNPNANIILCEGEKATDAARRILAGKGVICMTWAGGCKAVPKADWSLLANRKIVGWPDCDSQRDKRTQELLPYHEQGGMAAMLAISDAVAEHGATMRIVQVPQPGGEWPSGYDLADLEADGWDAARVLEFIKLKIADTDSIRQPVHLEDVPPADYGEYGQEPPEPPKLATRQPDTRPFKILGWDRGKAYYMPESLPQIVALVPAQHTKLNLLQLARLLYWQDNFPAESRTKANDGVNWDFAADALMQAAQKAGIWDAELIRGRGAWWDHKRWAVHLGDRVIMGATGEASAQYQLSEVPSKYIYEAGKTIDIALDAPLSNSQAVKLAQICEGLRWSSPVFGKLLAGWVFLAPVCGALDWRPHVWVTGGAGSGKTSIMVDIVGRCLEGIALKVEGETSEAGLRQALQFDGRPVVFDEFESERRKSAERVDDVLSMVVRASSETGADLLKGGGDGKANAYKSRSMFIFSSIAVNLKQHAARTRVSVLSLYTEPETPESLAQFNTMMDTIYGTLTDSYIQALQARAVHMIPTIRRNAKVFTEAAAIALKDRRAGDQIGALLAGAYGLYSTAEITREKAVEWINSQNWDDVTEANEQKDESACLTHILSHQLRVETEIGAVRTRTIGELIGKAAGMLPNDGDVTPRDAMDVLMRHGFMVSKNQEGVHAVRIAHPHKEIKRILAETAWQESYGRTLMRIPNAERLTPRKFGASSYRSVEITVESIFA